MKDIELNDDEARKGMGTRGCASDGRGEGRGGGDFSAGAGGELIL